MSKLFIPLLGVLILVQGANAQLPTRSDRRAIQRIQSDLSILANDSLEGRRAGTPGESKANRYITSALSSLGLEPKGSNGSFLQDFPIPDGKKIAETSHIILHGISLSIPGDAYPLSISANSRVDAKKVFVSVKEFGQPWFYDLHPILQENEKNPHFDLNAFIWENSESARKKGATAVIWYDSSSVSTPDIRFDPKYNGNTLDVPVVFIGKAGVNKLGFSHEGVYDISIRVQIEKSFRTAHNVIAYLDRRAPYTVIIGAHYDHLGYGEDGNSMLRNGSPAIHNGADDNASGTTAMLELARQYVNQKSFNRFNILFIAFSGEELGLLGSRFFTENPTIDLKQVSYMVNMDMVGRLSDSTRSITIGGYGTSPIWSDIIRHSNPHGLSIKFDSSGTGPSDHTSFYRKDIPVLFFFTGLHSDYHKPSDDMDKINASGILRVIHFIQEILLHSEHQAKLPFTKTREQQTSTNARFTVSMGIMPDYSYSGNGVRIDGVSEGKAAKKAGILAGDVLISLGSFKISSVESYMQALSKFKKGDPTQVAIQRNGSILTFDIVF
jgi:aminopeptidase YwaD